jgi:polyhydroxyalkanoate synthesis regulator phasin
MNTTNPKLKIMLKLFTTTLLAGIVGSTLAAIYRPGITAIPFSVAGGVLAGASLVNEEKRKRIRKESETLRVSTAFQYSYDKNKGIIAAEELAFFGDIDRNVAEEFLQDLAQENNGTEYEIGENKVYVFPHPQNILENIYNNAKLATDQVSDEVRRLSDENSNLKKALLDLQRETLQNKHFRDKAQPPRISEELLNRIQQNRNPVETQDPNDFEGSEVVESPWSGLLK